MRLQVLFALPGARFNSPEIPGIAKVINEITMKSQAVDELIPLIHTISDLRQLFYFGDHIMALLEDAMTHPETIPTNYGPIFSFFVPMAIDFCSLSGTILGLDVVGASVDFITHAFSRMAEVAVTKILDILKLKIMMERKSNSEGSIFKGSKIGADEVKAGEESSFSNLSSVFNR